MLDKYMKYTFQFNKYDYYFLTGTWPSPFGAAFNVTGEDCYEAGLGTYGKPTEKGQKLIDKFFEEHSGVIPSI